jgi:vacuolar protein sorting-associated protein VTA1
MTDEIPVSLKAADLNISKCANRAAQLQSVDPIMAYWCKRVASFNPQDSGLTTD